MSSNVEDIQQILVQRFGAAEPFGKIVAFDLGADGIIRVDGTGAANAVTQAAGPADTTLVISTDNCRKMLQGELDPTSAFMSGKLKISGDMGVALKLASALG